MKPVSNDQGFERLSSPDDGRGEPSPGMSRVSPVLEAAGAIVLAALPLAMAVANRSSPLVLAIAAILFLVAALLSRDRSALADLAGALTSPLGLTTVAFLAWCGLSFAWSPFPALSLRSAGEFVPTLAAGTVVARLAPTRLPSATPLLAAALLALACAYVVASLALDLAPQVALGQRAVLFMFNRPALTILLVAGPLGILLATSGHRFLGAALVVLGAVTILRTISGAAAMGLIAGIAMAAIAALAPKRIGLGIAATGLLGALVLAPVEGDILHRVMPEAAHERLVHSSSRARVAIAQSFGAVVAAEPWLGAGYGTGARFAETPVAAALEPEMRRMLAVGHPHNSFLQVWAELGLPGAILAAAALMLMLRAIAPLPKPLFATALGLVAAAAAVAFVEHGAWQAWWTAGLGAAITWLRAASLRHRTQTS